MANIYQSKYSGKQIDNSVIAALNLTNYQNALNSNGVLDITKLRILASKLLGNVPSSDYATTAGTATSATSATSAVKADIADSTKIIALYKARDEQNLSHVLPIVNIGGFILLENTNSLYLKVVNGTNLSSCVQLASGIGEPQSTLVPPYTDRYQVIINALYGNTYALPNTKRVVSLIITLPTASELPLSETITNLTFTTHADVGATLTINGGTVVFKGEDISNGTFTPQENTTYELSIWYNGTLWVGSVVKWQ